jgi:phosphoribosylaminoimidazole-succinocarboxamide synthase
MPIFERGLQKESYLKEDYLVLEKYTRALFQRGTEIAASRIDIG